MDVAEPTPAAHQLLASEGCHLDEGAKEPASVAAVASEQSAGQARVEVLAGRLSSTSKRGATCGQHCPTVPRLPLTGPLQGASKGHKEPLPSMKAAASSTDEDAASETTLPDPGRTTLADDSTSEASPSAAEDAPAVIAEAAPSQGVRSLCLASLPTELTYLTLCLNDDIAEDVTSLFYKVFDFIQGAIKQGGRVLLHCSQGVSRSAALAVAHHMWRTDLPYDQATVAIKAHRGVVNPNMNFMCQLLKWQTHRQQGGKKVQLYSVVPHSSMHGGLLILRPSCQQHQTVLLDRRGTFVLSSPETIFLWKGSQAGPSLIAGAWSGILGLQRYEDASCFVEEVEEGEESQDFVQALQSCILSSSDIGKGMAWYGQCPRLGALYEVHQSMLSHPPGYRFVGHTIPGRGNVSGASAIPPNPSISAPNPPSSARAANDEEGSSSELGSLSGSLTGDEDSDLEVDSAPHPPHLQGRSKGRSPLMTGMRRGARAVPLLNLSFAGAGKSGVFGDAFDSALAPSGLRSRPSDAGQARGPSSVPSGANSGPTPPAPSARAADAEMDSSSSMGSLTARSSADDSELESEADSARPLAQQPGASKGRSPYMAGMNTGARTVPAVPPLNLSFAGTDHMAAHGAAGAVSMPGVSQKSLSEATPGSAAVRGEGGLPSVAARDKAPSSPAPPTPVHMAPAAKDVVLAASEIANNAVPLKPPQHTLVTEQCSGTQDSHAGPEGQTAAAALDLKAAHGRRQRAARRMSALFAASPNAVTPRTYARPAADQEAAAALVSSQPTTIQAPVVSRPAAGIGPGIEMVGGPNQRPRAGGDVTTRRHKLGMKGVMRAVKMAARSVHDVIRKGASNGTFLY
ncbi:hypothetical protein WJX73_007157 [Symbiochloris irregularis]|uniref:Protein-tyrosine-phosphatase n=1 Tax=Symbiochloris irregularis TaxID=706552 RepID=A0AAW1P1R2_9CHLO